MYLLHCSCGHPLTVTASAAGSQVTCPECGKPLEVPRLGDLRSYPLADSGELEPVRQRMPLLARVLFAFLMIGAVISAGVSAYGAFRWQSLPEPPTSAEIIENDSEGIMQLNPLEVLGMWEQYRNLDLTQQRPFPYQQMQTMRDNWRDVCFASLKGALLFVLAACIAIVVGRVFATGDT